MMQWAKKKYWWYGGVLAILVMGFLNKCVQAEVMITGHDIIIRQGYTATLSAKAETRFISFLQPDIKNLTVTFLLDGQVLGSGVSDKDGIAKVSYLTTKPGVYKIAYQITGKKFAYRSGRLFVVSGERPALVTDIDGTISDYPDWKVPFGGGSAPTFANAPELFRQLAGKYDIVYLTARDDVWDKATLAFLNKHNFPEGAILYNELGLSGTKRKQLSSKHHGSFKLAAIEKLQENGIIVAFGIGNAATDAAAYVKAGIDSYLIKDKKYNIKPPSVVFESYSELEQLLSKKETHYLSLVAKK